MRSCLILGVKIRFNKNMFQKHRLEHVSEASPWTMTWTPDTQAPYRAWPLQRMMPSINSSRVTCTGATNRSVGTAAHNTRTISPESACAWSCEPVHGTTPPTYHDDHASWTWGPSLAISIIDNVEKVCTFLHLRCQHLRHYLQSLCSFYKFC